MSGRPVRKKQPFLFWFPPWRSPSQPSKQPKPPSIPAQLPPDSSQSSPQLDDDRAQLPPPPLSPPSSEVTKVPSLSDSEELVDKSDEHLTLPQEEKTKTEFESEQVEETVSNEVEEKPGVDMEPKKDSEAYLEEIREEKPKLDSEAYLEEIREEKPKLDSEAQQLQQDDKISPTKIAETRQINEEFHSEGEETLKEEVSGEPKMISEPKISINVSDSVSPSKTTEQETKEKSESTNGNLKTSKRHKSTMKERKITICTLPQPSSQNLKDRLSKLIQKLSIGYQNKLENEQGLNIITLASENQGASMFISHEKNPRMNVLKSNETIEERYHNVKGNQSFVASINSNVQGINSSILQETKYKERNPGVHMTISTKATAPVRFTNKIEAQKATTSLISPQKLTYDPNIRRRCLRGLFLESSEDDMENSQKPRRHGCRFSCDDKKKW